MKINLIAGPPLRGILKLSYHSIIALVDNQTRMVLRSSYFHIHPSCIKILETPDP